MRTIHLFAILAVAAFSGRGNAQTPTDQMTAEEVHLQAINAYNGGDYATAVAGFERFEKEYGASEQGKVVLASIRYPLAMSLLHLQKFEEALDAIDACLKGEPKPTPEQREDLIFYQGVCLMQAEEYEAARAIFASFAKEFPKAKQLQEALLLVGTMWLLEEKYDEAAKTFAEIKPRLDGVNRGRASVLELYALLEAENREAAQALVIEEYPRMNNMLQIATFQTLALGLGAQLLEEEEYRKAIQILQRVWTKDRLTRYQERRLSELEDALAAAEAQPKSDPYRKMQLKQMIAKVKRELQSLDKIENFDSALRLRLAGAYQGMERYREAALIMDDMLDRMPPDPVVESASTALVQCWSAIERWPRVIAAARKFEEKFPESKELPMVRYLQGVAEQRANDQEAAIATFDAIHKAYPDSAFAARALFMRGFSQLLAERNAEAVATFEAFPKEFPDHEMAESAAYWRAMGYSLDKQFPQTREAVDQYLKMYPNGTYRGLAVFRKAYAAQSMKDYDIAVRELRAYLKDYPGHESNSEALLLLGDALMAKGEMEEGIATFKRIPPEETKFFEEGWFKVGKAHRLLEEPDAMRAHFEQFAKEHLRSPRVAEAIYWIGWTHRQAGEPEKTRDAYWAAIEELGADPTIRSVDDLFPALQKLYDGETEQAQYFTKLRDLNAKADARKESTLAMRTLWAQGRARAKSDPVMARQLMIQAAERADIPNTNPLLLADFAVALGDVGRTDESEAMWRDLVKWNPRAPQKDQAFASLGINEAKRGNEKEALRYFDRFEKETLGSMLFGRVMMERAALLEKQGDHDGARASLEKLLANEYSAGKDKAEALYRIGSLHMKEGSPQLAVPYFQRIYIMHGRWREWVARAYLGSGEAFEELKDVEAARKTYAELVAREDLGDLPETKTARERLTALGGPV